MQEGNYSGPDICGKVISTPNVTIRAEIMGKVIIDCTARSRHFSIVARDVRIEGLSLINGFAQQSGGCVYVNESGAVLQDCILERCITSGNGGGIVLASAGSELLLHRTAIQICSALNGGGVFVNASARVRLLQTGIIQRCTASTFGGALYLSAGANATIDAESFVFLNNTANTRGGAVYATTRAYLSLSGKIKFTSNGILVNSASAVGGALFAAASTILIGTESVVQFQQNYCIYSGGALALYTGTIWQARGNVSLIGALLSRSKCMGTMGRTVQLHNGCMFGLQATRPQLTAAGCC